MRVLSLAAYELGLPRLLYADLEAMRAAHAATVAALDDNDLVASHLASRSFHNVVIRAAGNRELRRMLALILARFERLFRLMHLAGTLPNAVASQAAILDAIENRDLERALAAYRDSLETFERALEQLPMD